MEDELQGTAAQLFVVALQDDVCRLHERIGLLEDKVSAHREDHERLLLRMSRGIDVGKLKQDLARAGWAPEDEFVHFRQSLQGSWVEGLLLAVADPLNTTVRVYGPPASGKSLWCGVVSELTSLVKFTNEGDLYGANVYRLRKGKCRLVVSSSDASCFSTDVDVDIKASRTAVAPNRQMLGRFWLDIL